MSCWLETFDAKVATTLHVAVGGAPPPAQPAPSTTALDALVVDVANALECSPMRARAALVKFLDGAASARFSLAEVMAALRQPR